MNLLTGPSVRLAGLTDRDERKYFGAHGVFFDPLAFARAWDVAVPAHVTHDPNVAAQYRIRRGLKHDGTYAHVLFLVDQVLRPVAERTTFYKHEGEPSAEEWPRVRYVVGLMRLVSVHTMVDLPVGRRPGQRLRITLPVRIIRP